MHYSIRGISEEIIIKSENAAKSYMQPNKFLMNLLSHIGYIDMALDYGCGKARYTLFLTSISRKVNAVDSSIQITRKQNIWGNSTTLLNWSTELPNLTVFSIDDSTWKAAQYDFILCCNVLSAIPDEYDRLIVLHNIKNCLKCDGKALITTQYRNSYFSLYKSNPNAIEYNDGWIINRKGNFSFYGLINKTKLLRYIDEVGLTVIESVLHDGSAYISVKS